MVPSGPYPVHSNSAGIARRFLDKRLLLGCWQAFLRLSKAQKDSLAAIYSAHLVNVDALRSECLGVASKLQVCASFFAASQLLSLT